MADTTKIAWTDSTWNPWIGCTKIAPGCDNCYAEARDARFHEGCWGPKNANRRTGADNWRKPARWHRQASAKAPRPHMANTRHLVFCGSLMDWCDKDDAGGCRQELWKIIRNTPFLTWQLLTKRASLIERNLPDDWENGYPNVWLGITVEDREHGYRRMDILRDIPARVRFLSCEPLLEDISTADFSGFDWAIIGGESLQPGQNPELIRPMDPAWVDSAMTAMSLAGVPIFFKQWGGLASDKGGDLYRGRQIQNFPDTTWRW